jgi:phospholipid transport system substrate-binding protein
VRTRIGGDVGPAVSIDYRLFKHGTRWAVYDVVHEGVSLVANYRSQFSSVLGTSSFAGVLERMRINESQARGRPETAAALGKRLLLFSVVAERGAR